MRSVTCMFKSAEKEARAQAKVDRPINKSYYKTLAKESLAKLRAEKKEEALVLRSVVKMFGGKIATRPRTPKQTKPVE